VAVVRVGRRRRRAGGTRRRRRWRQRGGGFARGAVQKARGRHKVAAARWRLCTRGGAEGARAAQGGGAGAREIYDRWTPWIFLSPVDPTLRVRTPVDCVGVVYPRLHQICI
jgi:hypothetical protein